MSKHADSFLSHCIWFVKLISAGYDIMLMSCSLKLEIQATPASLCPTRLTSMKFKRHVRNELRRRSRGCPPRLYRQSFIITFTCYPLPMISLMDCLPENRERATWLLNHSRGHLRSTWTVMKSPTMRNCHSISRMSLPMSTCATLP